ncbi:MAG: LemA family protein [Bacteroidetes bacterium]|nr:MAG: LemA family protein [Bacteroidota bacterium]REK06512.1 MAG: LemA family protein [Bacteroidota bacterium]REK33278.1 MAG: LemA family protein [Bacteroidota bacterium]REK49678.1 MAG: LemA family protein [Bacteroidota bacterium]
MRKYFWWIVLGLLVIWGISSYNGLVGIRENVNKSWANVENQYQRRADLIPNLVETVKGAADFEKSTLEAVTQARASATSMKIDPNDLTPENIQKYQAVQGQLGSALGRLLAVAENYPQLKAVQNFQDLQAQLEGTENRINEARRQYNEAAQSYNTQRLSFPRVVLARILGFGEKPYFESDKGSEKAPDVKF